MTTQTKLHTRTRIFTSLGCLVLLAMSTSACDPEDLDDSSELEALATVDELAVQEQIAALEQLDGDSPNTINLSPAGELHSDDPALTWQEPADQLAALPDPNDVYIEGIIANGAGCPSNKPGSVVSQIATDQKSFILIFQDMLLENPPGPPIKTTNCLASVKLHVPNGWQVSVATVNTRGYAFLEKGLTARQTSNYFFAGDPIGFSAHTQLKGYYDDFYVFTDKVPFQSVVWSKCGASAIFAINTTLNLNAIKNKKGYGIFNTTDVDGAFKKQLHWQWKKC
ncbi:DUF4360 domain-containing protein [Enhygromyxa salina]|uniref:Secreted protein n=1 Tax=Enhygromyxa salina TaxID=215803 RepID=A0A2S9Y0J5_9BACT|nr:DUF4360 domain-containing protein [Enhygromyxa salina]PRP98624.1 hypothetical protein ENSA7_65670 [Enhygromyxa salina]